MSLLYWLPMTDGIVKNQGLSAVAPTTSGAVSSNNNGKLGKCVQLGANSGEIIIPHQDLLSYSGPFSVSFWINIISNPTSWATIFGITGTSASWAQEFICFQRNGNDSTYSFVVANGSSSTNNNFLTDALTLNTWYHFTLIQDSDKKMYIYQNGDLLRDYSTTITPNFAQIQNFKIGKSDTVYQGNFLINDFRFYTNALSPLEVKHLAQGLVLHYPLNRGGLGPSNLLKNGFGELGSENWTSSTSISTTDIPSGQSDIKASFSGGYTIEHIIIYPTHNYKFSTWIKATAASGNTYPSLYPYDVDEKFIDYFKCPAGFNLNTMTTLKQELKSGDTKIYVNDLSQWNANSGHYYNWAAIFGYKDSTGHIYPDGTYTQNCVRFGNSTNEKTNLDKTNNIITLTSAYTGPTMPIGTKLCASTEGATYYYPLDGINLSTIQDWTYKERVFSGNDARLRYAKTVTFWTSNSNRMAGIKIVDLTYENMDSTIEYDCSGYGNNGTRVGTFNWSGDTPRYNTSTYVNSSSSIDHPRCLSNDDQEWTCCAWVKLDNSTSYQQLNNFNRSNAVVYGTTPILYLNGGSDDYYMYGSQVIPVNEWTHIAFVFKNSTGLRNIYINGILKNNNGPNKTSTPSGIPDSVTLFGQNFAGYVSDYREYATALSADDIMALYKNAGYVDSDGNMYAYEMTE